MELPDTIFVRVYESSMDLLRAVIKGAEGTPYHDVSELLSVLMIEKLEGKGTNAERLAALEGAVNQVLDASEAHRLEVATQMQVLTKAVSELTEAIKGPKKKHKKS
ncbi:unnamed protein product [Lactuca saligna]|uniref:Cell division protein ZapA n=1 Tax=Lactuca saligna TaxID=75948 RepID=A0AA36A3E4_LACSI|nr:unnamed protein product [Lactuca saligna]